MRVIRDIVACPRDCYDTCFLRIYEKSGKYFIEHLDIPYGFKIGCPRASKDFDRAFSKKRILYPQLANPKGTNKFKRIDWKTALELLTSKLKDVLDNYGSDKVLVIDYAGNRGLLTRYFSKRLWFYLRASFINYNLCDYAGYFGIKLHYGSSYGANIKDIRNSKLFIYWGFNAIITAPHIFYLTKKTKGKIIVIDSLYNETARNADIYIQPKFGSDIFLALGVANYLIQNELYDKEFIEKYTFSFEEFRRQISKFTVNYVSELTGIPPEQIKDFAEIYAYEKPSIIFIGYGLQRRFGGGETVRAISLLPALIGLHRGFYYSNTDGLNINFDYIMGGFLGKPSRIIPQSKVGVLLERGEFKFVFIYLTNPAATYPNAGAIRRGLLRNDVFVVVHETHWTDTAMLSDLVLPAPTWLEKEDIITSYFHNYIVLNKKVINPLGESISEVDLMRKIAERLGISQKEIYEDPFLAVKKAIGKAAFEEMMSKGYAELPLKPKDKYQTPTGKIEFYSITAEKLGYNSLPEPIKINPPKDYPFILVSSASPKYTHTQFEDVYRFIPPILLMSPKDMRKLNLKDGDIVIVESKLGRVMLRVKESNKVPQGIVFTFRSCKTLDGKRINEITTDELNEFEGASINTTYVRIIRVKH